MFTGLLFHMILHVLRTVLLSGFQRSLDAGKFCGSGRHSKHNCLQGQANFTGLEHGKLSLLLTPVSGFFSSRFRYYFVLALNSFKPPGVCPLYVCIAPPVWSKFLQKATTIGCPPNFPKLLPQLWGIPKPQYFITLLLGKYQTYFW